MAQVLPIVIREDWHYNFEHELSLIHQAISSSYSFVCFDTEFPGTVVDMPPDVPKYSYASLPPSQIYSHMKNNVDLLQIIQLGLTLSDANGNLPSFSTPYRFVWQFNFRDFDPNIHRYNPKSIELLLGLGTNFTKNKIIGIDSRVFANKFRTLLSSNAMRYNMGLGCVTWITFHGTYDFGLLIKILTGKELPASLESFMMLVVHFFGHEVYDLKIMARCLGRQGGLVRVAKDCGVERTTGTNHQAGSDSLLIMQTFMTMRKIFLMRAFNMKHISLKVEGLV